MQQRSSQREIETMNFEYEKNKIYDWSTELENIDFIEWEKEMEDEDLD